MSKYWMIHPDLYNVDKDGVVCVPIQIEPDEYHNYEADSEYVQVEIPPMDRIKSTFKLTGAQDDCDSGVEGIPDGCVIFNCNKAPLEEQDGLVICTNCGCSYGPAPDTKDISLAADTAAEIRRLQQQIADVASYESSAQRKEIKRLRAYNIKLEAVFKVAKKLNDMDKDIASWALIWDELYKVVELVASNK